MTNAVFQPPAVQRRPVALGDADRNARWIQREVRTHHHARTPPRVRAPAAQPDEPAVQFAARRGGKSQALIDQMLAQANERGIRVEVVYPQLSDDAVEVMAKYMAQAASDWNDVERGEHEHTLECTNWVAYRDDARTALRAANNIR